MHDGYAFIDQELSTKTLGLVKWSWFLDKMVAPAGGDTDAPPGPTISKDEEENTPGWTPKFSCLFKWNVE